MRRIIKLRPILIRPAQRLINLLDLQRRRLHPCASEQPVLRAVLYKNRGVGRCQRRYVRMVEIRMQPEGIEHSRVNRVGDIQCTGQRGHPSDNDRGTEPRFGRRKVRRPVTAAGQPDAPKPRGIHLRHRSEHRHALPVVVIHDSEPARAGIRQAGVQIVHALAQIGVHGRHVF
jgi:hypothetical protein